jgi:hypothetical protein
MSFNFQCSFASDFKHGKTTAYIVPELFDRTKNCEWLEKNNSSFVLGFSGLLCVEWAIFRVSSFSHQICGSFFNLTYIVFLSKPTVGSWWQCRGSYCSLALASVMKVIDNLWVTHWGLRWVMRIKTTHSCSASFSLAWAGWTVPSKCCLGVFSAISNICDYTQHTRHWLKNQCCGVKWQQMSALYIYGVQWLWC